MMFQLELQLALPATGNLHDVGEKARHARIHEHYVQAVGNISSIAARWTMSI